MILASSASPARASLSHLTHSVLTDCILNSIDTAAALFADNLEAAGGNVVVSLASYNVSAVRSGRSTRVSKR